MNVSSADGTPKTFKGFSWSKIIDAMVGTSVAQGDIAYRNASVWARLQAGSAGQVLKTNGAAANPSYTSAGGIFGAGLAFIGSTTLVAQGASILVSGLDIDADEAYYCAFELKGNSVGVFDVALVLNADTNPANYNRELATFSGATTTPNRINNGLIVASVATAGELSGYFTVRRNLNSKANALVYWSSLATTSINFGVTAIQWATANNVTSMSIDGSVASCFTAGSYLNVWRIHS